MVALPRTCCVCFSSRLMRRCGTSCECAQPPAILPKTRCLLLMLVQARPKALPPLAWVAVKEFNLSYYWGNQNRCYIYVHTHFVTSFPEQQPSSFGHEVLVCVWPRVQTVLKQQGLISVRSGLWMMGRLGFHFGLVGS